MLLNSKRVELAELHALLGADDKEGSRLIESVESFEIKVAAIHNIERARLEDQIVEPVDFVAFSLGNRDKAGDRAAQIQKGIDLDGRLGGAKPRPWKQTQAQVDGGGIQSVSGGVEFHGKTVLGVELSRSSNQHGGDVGVDAPVASLVGIGQSAAAHPPAKLLPPVIQRQT